MVGTFVQFKLRFFILLCINIITIEYDYLRRELFELLKVGQTYSLHYS